VLESAQGGAQPNISTKKIEELQIYWPEAPKRDALTRRIHAQFAELDRLTAEAAAARRQLDRLDQAVLTKAFRGELVPQDPADEPASVLLDRIRAERACALKVTRGRPKAVS
jgi:type I restriction enzyme S subunit